MLQKQQHEGCRVSLLPASVLFVCGLNSIRSPIAEALMQKYFPGIYVASAGIFKGEHDPFASAVMAEENMLPDSHDPRGLEDLADDFFDLVITLTPQAYEAVLEQMRGFSVDVEYWPIPDPSRADGSRMQILNAYRSVRDVLKKRIYARFSVNNR